MMNSFEDSAYKKKNSLGSKTSNNASKRSITWKHDVSQDCFQDNSVSKKKLKLSQSKSPQRFDLKCSRVSARVKKPTPDKTENKREQCNQTTTPISGGNKLSGADRKCMKATDSTLTQKTAPRLNTKHSSSTQTDSQNLGSGISETDVGALKYILQKAIEGYEKCKNQLNETKDNLDHVVGEVKKYCPSVLESLPMNVSNAAEGSCENANNVTPHYSIDTDTILKPDLRLVQKMTIIMKEFDSYALVLETIPESAVIKESLFKQLTIREEWFETNFTTFKQRGIWILDEGLRGLEDQHQKFARKRYESYMENLDLKMAAMKEKMNALQEKFSEPPSQSREQHVREPHSNKSNDSLFVVASPSSHVSSNNIFSSASPVNNSLDLAEAGRSKDVSENKIDKRSTLVRKQGWPGKSLPALDDMLSEESQAESCDGEPTSYTSQSSPPPPSVIQDESTDDIVEALISEVGHELETDEKRDQDVGSHFLAPQFASVYSPTGPGFLYNVPVKSAQMPDNSNSENVCSGCQELFETKEQLYVHKLHTHVTRVCNICMEIFQNVKVLTEHVSQNHKSHTVCPECYIAVETSSLSSHAAKHPESNKKTQEKHKCRACFKVFKSQEEVTNHEKDHKNAFNLCKHCGVLFLTRLELQKHSSQEHLADKSNVCKVCFLDFPERLSLSRHLKVVHNMTSNRSPKKFVCICCNQQVHSKTELIQHMRENHQNDDLVEQASRGEDTGPPRNKCTNCTLYFKNAKVRAVHEIVFHETAPFICGCNKSFFTKEMSDHHFLQHTKLEEESIKGKRRPKVSK